MEESLLNSTNSALYASCDEEFGPVDHPPKRSRLKPHVAVIAVAASLGGLIFGFQFTGAGGTFVMSGFRRHFGWECPADDAGCVHVSDSQMEKERSLISAMLTIGASFGALINPVFVERFGRVPDMKLSSVIFIGGALVCALAPSVGVLYAGRFVSGFAIGMYALCVPVYIAECSPVDHRGQLMTCWQFMVTTGLLLGQGVNVGLQKVDWGWRVSFSLGGIFAIVLLICLFTFMPESPRFIASRSSNEGEDKELSILQRSKLRNVMGKLRYDEDVDHAMEAIEREVLEDKELGDASWPEVFAVNNRMRYRVLLGVALQAFTQLSGNEAIVAYSPMILERMFGDAILWSFLLGIINFVAVCFSMLTIDRFGRLPLFFVGGITMFASQIASSIYQSIPDPSNVINGLFFSSLAVFSFAHHCSWGPLAWDICAEMFPLRERGKAVGLTTLSNFLFNTAVAASFSYTIDISPDGSFAFFVVCIAANLMIAYFFLPETAHKTSGEIEESFMNHRPRICRRKGN